ncbi:hypothetical protein G647_06650 [Cladophialophora carrionii CBS 160.54]|uniref:Guanylate cyclase domain-containing protein n=1 Tax=Cladophialophora carrionii CBS 160.54 TaxID=1279043 RepID=V9D6N5_9EURO|nr:uncharacterized protein G647_06650 [Cladophialophora carrionii CBS 160.54]ETI22574.1 hypothetical protein G647_06650 [Cladophialophora carrionii CBS 160.54]
MPKLGLRELRRSAQGILAPSSIRQQHGILLTSTTGWSSSNLTTAVTSTDLPSRRNLSSTGRWYRRKLEPRSTDNALPKKGMTTAAAMVSNDLPARGIPPPVGPISIVFTDIVKSTNIWEKDTDAMISAMQLHDDTVRSLTLSNNGYEVKQNGDGFMIAFPTATSAVQFCLDVQEKLLDEEWPKALLKLAPGQETTDDKGHVLFRGLQLRMSAHWGEPVSKWNEVIQRMDYLGPVVNRAARFVQVTEGGQIVVSEDFLAQLQREMQGPERAEESREGIQSQPLSPGAPSTAATTSTSTSSTAQHSPPPDLSILRSKAGQQNVTTQYFQIRELGHYEFQGLDDPQKLYFIVPRSLEGRVEHWHQVTHVTGVKGNVKTD